MSAPKKRARRWSLAGAAVVLAAAAAFFLLRSCGSSGSDWRESFRPVTVEAVRYQDSVEISGNLEPLRARDLAFPVPGKVVQVQVQAGERVAKDALLARLDNQVALYELSLIEGTLEQKRYSAPARELKNLELERDIKAQAVRDRELRAPFSGLVTMVEVEPGEFTSAGRKVLRIADLSSLKAKVQIDELDAPRVKPGLPVRFYFDALPELEVTGRVASLSEEGRITPDGLAVLDGEVLIERPPARLLSGYSFTGEILIGQEQQVLVVPRAALMREGEQTFVYMASAGGLKKREVEASVLGEESIRILSGLEAGEVVLVPLERILGQRPGAKITTSSVLQDLKRRIRLPSFGGQPSGNDTSANGSR
jgi:multidrug efflux pump subunit AcrA (membrane-fusion protein)